MKTKFSSAGDGNRGPVVDRRILLKSAGVAGAMMVGRPAWSAPGRAMPELDETYGYYCPDLVEITAPGRLVGADGSAGCSWSRRPYLELNLEDAKYASPGRRRRRIKQWDMYHLITPDHYLTFLVAWIGWGAFASAYVYDRAARTGWDGMKVRPGWPEVPMMKDSTAGVTDFRRRALRMTFEVTGERRRLKVDFPGFADRGLVMDVELEQPAVMESVCAAHLTRPGRMHYNHKINNMTAEGELRLGDRSYALSPESSFGMLDFSRGYPPDRQFWYWAVSSGRLADGRLFGFNLGYGNSPDQTNENALMTDRELTKIGKVVCEVPDDRMKPWRIYTADRAVDLVFTPESVRDSNLDLGSLYSIGQTALGTYDGRARLDSGETVEVQDLFGLYEWFDQKW